ncbi:spore coat protein YlbD [Peribacillus loiseleuriae]|uniref:spore coat protein YlbD n=1 Tax=Peribacillus loiseleuriae TaxID=1679170 RepID=UPI0038216CA4
MVKRKRPSVDKFKEFVRTHPGLTNQVKAGKYSWQQLFEEWYLLGGSHEKWIPYMEEKEDKKVEETKSTDTGDMVSTLVNTFKNMDVAQIQQYISNANQALGAIQGILTSFQGDKSVKEEPKKIETRQNPFVFKKD